MIEEPKTMVEHLVNKINKVFLDNNSTDRCVVKFPFGIFIEHENSEDIPYIATKKGGKLPTTKDEFYQNIVIISALR